MDSHGASCPVCQKTIRIPEAAEGKKIRCGGCASTHRILREPEGAYHLVVLEEVLPQQEAVAEAAAAPSGGGIRLKTRRDKYREEGATGTTGRATRSTRGRRRR